MGVPAASIIFPMWSLAKVNYTHYNDTIRVIRFISYMFARKICTLRALLAVKSCCDLHQPFLCYCFKLDACIASQMVRASRSIRPLAHAESA